MREHERAGRDGGEDDACHLAFGWLTPVTLTKMS